MELKLVQGRSSVWYTQLLCEFQTAFTQKRVKFNFFLYKKCSMNVNEANSHCPSHRRCALYVGFISFAKIAASVTHFILSLVRSIVMRVKMTSIIF